MALMMGPLRPDCTKGEELTFEALRRYLPEDYQVWPELPVQSVEERKCPDFVLLHPMWGVIVLEVKDYVRILSADPYGVTVRRRDGSEGRDKNPVDQAKGYSDTIADMIRDTHSRARDEGSFHGPLPRVSRACGAVFTWLSGSEMSLLEHRLRGKGYLLCGDDLAKHALEDRLRSLPRPGGVERLNEDTLSLVRRALFPDGDMRHRGQYIGHLDVEQEIETKAEIFAASDSDAQEQELDEKPAGEQLALLQEPATGLLSPDVDSLELSEQGEQLAEQFKIRLVRGVAGSGKTQILCKRAVLLSKLYPDWSILVLTRNKGLAADLRDLLGGYPSVCVRHFEKLCRDQLESVGLWRQPVSDTDQINWIKSVSTEVPDASQFDPRFLRDEFNWVKYIDRRDRDTYLSEGRDGREVPLTRPKRRIVFEVFQRYEERLSRFRQMTWADIPLLMADAMEDSLLPTGGHDAILIDEAQMFPPTWFAVVKKWLKRPHGMLFLAADMTQNIYARFSWAQKGLNVRGRSRILRRSYRNSPAIARGAYHLVSSDDDLQALLRKDGDELIEPDLHSDTTAPGNRPRLVSCGSLEAELQYLANHVKILIQDQEHAVWPSEIAILCLKEHTQQRVATHLSQNGVPVVLASEHRNGADGPRVLVGLIAGITGQEFTSVLVCDLQELFDTGSAFFGGSWPEFKAMQLRLLYTAMTRARRDLHLCYRQQLHSALQPLRDVTTSVEV